MVKEVAFSLKAKIQMQLKIGIKSIWELIPINGEPTSSGDMVLMHPKKILLNGAQFRENQRILTELC